MALREWLKPPRSLFIILSLVTLVSVSALGFFAWKLLDTERDSEAKRAQDRLEQAADSITATVRGVLADTGDRLAAWVLTPPAGDFGAFVIAPPDNPPDGLLLVIEDTHISAAPPGRLLF